MKNLKATAGLLYLLPNNLLTHPKNLRRFYPEDQVQEMADSIRTRKGVYQALRIVANGTEGKYFVVDGNMRLAGGRKLGKECPPLKCELVTDTVAEQLLAMLITAKVRFKPDPVSEALHYKRLIDEEHYSIRGIAQSTGIAETVIGTRLQLLLLDPEIQDLIAHGALSSDPRVTRAFLSISNTKARVKLATRLAADCASIQAILRSCDRLAAKLQETARIDSGEIPALSLGRQRSYGMTISPEKVVTWPEVRKAAKAMCQACDLKSSQLNEFPEPAWSLISHAAKDKCEHCDMREIIDTCSQCPGVEIIHRLIVLAGEQKA